MVPRRRSSTRRLSARPSAEVILGCLLLALWVAATFPPLPAQAADDPVVAFQSRPHQVLVTIAGQPIATYVSKDDAISRPYFAHVRAPGGIQVTRNHPPIEGQDPTDHPEYHPGIWMAFGDISESDYWRLKAPVLHQGFVEEPSGGPGEGGFAVLNRYVAEGEPSKTVCEEIARYTFRVTPSGYLLEWDSTFSADAAGAPFYFGDQEEMGIGFRIASPMYVEPPRKDKNAPPGNGKIVDSKGRKNESEIWGNAANWVDYSGTIAGKHAGITLMCHPGNFRPSWLHTRDYGVITVNPFGREAFGKGDKSKVVVRPGERLRLRYGVLLHADPPDSRPDLAAAYAEYIRLTGE